MTPKEELAALRRLAELEAKAGSATSSLPEMQAKADAWSKRNTDFIESLKAIPQGLKKGFTDVSGGITQAIAHGAASVIPGLKDSVAEYDKMLADREKTYQEDTKNSPVLAGTSRVAGNVIATLPASGLKVIKGIGMLPKMANAAIGGGIVGGSQPVLDGDYSTEKAKQVGLGATAAGLSAPAAEMFARMIKPKNSPQLQLLLDSGVNPTPGQIMGGALGRTEEKLTSIPILGDAIKSGQRSAVEDLNRAAYARALSPVGESTKAIGRQGVEATSKVLGEKYSNLLPKLSFKADQQFSQDLAKIQQMAGTLPDQQAKQFEKILRDKLFNKMTPQGNMSGESLKTVESEINAIAKGYSGDASFDNRQLGSALKEVLSSVRSGLSRSNPGHAEELAKINEGYANYARIRDAAGRIGSKDGVFSPSQLQSAVRAGDKSVGKGDFAKGNALMQDLSDAGVNILGPTYPDSGSIGRLLLGGGALGAGVANPAIPIGLGVASIPYLPGGRQAMAALLAKRPDIAAPIAEAVRKGSPLLGASAAALLAKSLMDGGN